MIDNLQYLSRLVGRLKPGHAITISHDAMREVSGFEHNGGAFTPADRILENVVGSAYEFLYTEHPFTRDVTFFRLAAPVEYGQAYVSPDRREFAVFSPCR